MDLDLSVNKFPGFPREIEYCCKCSSVNCTFHETDGYWECRECGTVWAYDEDDPDYDELIKVD